MELLTCNFCGCELDDDTAFYFGGSVMCEDCMDENTCFCNHCGERIWNDDNIGEDDRPLCEHCYNHHYTRCCNCDALLHNDDAYYDDDDEAYCCDCFHDRSDGSIHDYSYKPDPIFFGDGNRYFGVELEIDYGGKSCEKSDKILWAANQNNENVYIKSDGSLSDGLEIVTHPMCLDYHKHEMPWAEISKQALRLGYMSHKTDTCGLHIHVNRNTFGETREEQDSCISRVLHFVEHHWQELLKFSRRSEYQMNRWAARYGYKNTPREVMEEAKKGCQGRYACVNITNWNTIEFRMFRGTLKVNTIIATLELVNFICDLATRRDDEEITRISWSDFVLAIDKNENPELITYLKERRLYVNEPIENESEEE